MTVSWHEYRYDICAAPFGHSFFFSYWMVQKHDGIMEYINRIPWLGPWIIHIIKPITKYKVDTDTMFHTLIHQCMVDTIDRISKEKSLPPLSDLEKQSTIADIFKR